MKKKIYVMLAAMLAFSLVACGEKKTEDVAVSVDCGESASATEGVEEVYNPLDFVQLGNYKGVEIELDNSYEVTDQQVEDYYLNILESSGTYAKDEEATEVKEDSIVNCNYVGTQDGVEFAGGSAMDQTLDIAGNCDAVYGTGFIDGFTSGMIGHKVGEVVPCEVKFPDNYGAENLAGQTVTFTFTINYICKSVSVDEVDDAFIKANFDCETIEDFKKEIRSILEDTQKAARDNDIRTAVLDKVVADSVVSGLPDGFLDARVAKQIQLATEYYCKDGQTLEEFLASFGEGESIEKFTSELTEEMTTGLTQEMVFEAVAKDVGIEFDQEGFDSYVRQTASAAGMMVDPTGIYDSYTTDVESGENYMKRIYLCTKAIEYCVENAVVK